MSECNWKRKTRLKTKILFWFSLQRQNYVNNSKLSLARQWDSNLLKNSDYQLKFVSQSVSQFKFLHKNFPFYDLEQDSSNGAKWFFYITLLSEHL